jgi:predicted dithiol-disulfide oxidoreductase (DUF899 family)
VTGSAAPERPELCVFSTRRRSRRNIERNVVHLAHRDVTLIPASRAPVVKQDAYKKRTGWTFKWIELFVDGGIAQV